MLPENQSNSRNLYFGLPADEVRMVYQSNLEFFERLSGSHLLVMGGTGFVGKWIIALIGYAIESGNPMKLSLMSRSSRDEFEDFKNAPFEINWIIADLSLSPQLNFEEYTHVINAATPSTSSTGAVDPAYVHETIVRGNSSAIKSILFTQKTIRYVYLSSGAVTELEKAERFIEIDGCPTSHYTDLSSAYAHGKRVAEREIRSHVGQEGLTAQVLRLYAFAGPGIALTEHFAVGNFMNNALTNTPINIKGNPLTVRSYMYPTDLVSHIICSLTTIETETKEIGSNRSVTMRELGQIVSEQTNHVSVTNGNESQPQSTYVPSGPIQLNQTIELEESITRWWKWIHATRD